MQFDEKVLTALEVLTDAAENDFELYRICTLVRDLIAPPVAKQIDDTHQEFDGVAYRLKADDDRYYEKSRVSIHRTIWRHYHGNIPEGCEIHHEDSNPENNAVGNLTLKTIPEHRRIHACGALHQTLVASAKADAEKREWDIKVSIFYKFSVAEKTRFCSNSCMAHWREQQRPKTPDKICEWCGKPFHASQNNVRFCSRQCAAAAQFSRTETRTCPVCGKQFTSAINHKHIYCSEKCTFKAARERHKSKPAANDGSSGVV